MSSESNEHISLDMDGAPTVQELVTAVIVQGHLQGMAHLMVTRAGEGDAFATNKDKFGLGADDPLEDVLAKPAGNATSDSKKQYARQEALKRNMLAAILHTLKAHLPYAYKDVLKACGGQKKIFNLTLPRTMEILLAELTNDAETREAELVEMIKHATLKVDEELPFRHYANRVTTWLDELTEFGYVHPVSDLLRIIQSCLKPFAAESQVLSTQLDTYANKPRAQRTGQGLLEHLVAYERTRSAQGLTILESTTGSEHYAAKAATTRSGTALDKLTALSRDDTLSEEQRAIFDRYVQAAIDTVAFAGANPGKVKMFQHNHKHCPMHAFQPSHDSKGCNGGQYQKQQAGTQKEDKKKA